MNPLSNVVPCDLQAIIIVRNTTNKGAPQRKNYRKCPEIPVVSKVDLWAETKWEKCGANSKSNHVLRTHIKNALWFHKMLVHFFFRNKINGDQSDEICKFCKDIIESQEKHNSSGFCPKKKSSKTKAL